MTNNVVSSNPTHGEVYLIQHHVIKFVSNLPGADPGFQDMGGHLKKMRRAEGGTKNFGVFRVKKGGGACRVSPPLDPPLLAAGWWFSVCNLVSSTNKTDRHDITEILLKVVLNTINLTPSLLKTLVFSLICV